MADQTDVATREQPGRAIVAADDHTEEFRGGGIMALAREMALNPNVDGNKLETIMRVANQQQDREREIEFYQDKNRAVRAMPRIRKDGRIVIIDKAAPEDRSRDRTQGHFEKWSDVQRAITPVLDENHLTLTHKIAHSDGRTIVIAVLTHDNGYREESGEMALPLDTSGGKNNVQGAGSSQTYGMRYTARAILGLKLEGGQDDDGNLIPLADEPLNDQQERRMREAEAAWESGPEFFEDWFGKIPAIDRAWMIQTGRYRDITGEERGMLTARHAAGAADGPKPEPKREPVRKAADGPDVSTPEGWTEQYEIDCRTAQTIIDLATIQRKATKAISKLAESPDSALYDRVIAAGKAADQRLRGED